MTQLRSELEARCVAALRAHLDGAGEPSLHAAYELGRDALGRGFGVLDFTAVLHAALAEVASAAEPGNGREVVRRAEPFLLECFSPFEMSLRGAREANAALRRLDEVREAEIRRLARELHDEAGQMLVAAHLTLREVARELGPRAREPLERVRDRLRTAENELRRIAHEMRPSMLEDLGLVPALAFLARGIAARHGLEVRVEGELVGRLPHDAETALYRVAQEALNNAARHARARAVTLSISQTTSRLRISVADDGCGFDPRAVGRRSNGGGFGLRGIMERLEPWGGSLDIRSAPGVGTELCIQLPLLEAHHAAGPVG
ncbi:MAG: sensor histidine kinase [Candidatus Eisenbacteria bacterium]|uniref:Oxygen sensor histidine kinase NreB n=1 Tax=Eiseniibacteriota bacterium TaxID=2212470 RepID=A0A538U6B2_UNCEI|nr:MAG: sensor histidine kinase [Candidatus Eisenbacteria bacterium]